jgi:hypothetical protein
MAVCLARDPHPHYARDVLGTLKHENRIFWVYHSGGHRAAAHVPGQISALQVWPVRAPAPCA